MSGVSLTAQIEGMNQLHTVLMNLADDFRSRVTRQATVAAAKELESDYRTLLPEGTQPAVKKDKTTGKYVLRAYRIKQAVAHKIWPYPDRTGFSGIIGVMSRMAPHAHLIEDGTKYRYRTKKGIGGKYAWVMTVKKLKPGDPGTRTGTMPASHPLLRSFNLGIGYAKDTFIAVLQQGIRARAI